MQIRVEESGSLYIRLLFIRNMLLQAVHILSANILVVTQSYGFNVKWITKITEFSWTIPTVKMKSLLNSDLKQCRDIFCCPQRAVMSHDLLLFYHNSLLYPKTLFSQKPVFWIHSICVWFLQWPWIGLDLCCELAAMLKQLLINSLG